MAQLENTRVERMIAQSIQLRRRLLNHSPFGEYVKSVRPFPIEPHFKRFVFVTLAADLIAIWLLSACTRVVDVAREVPEQIEVTRELVVEATREVEVTREVALEVTREVEIVVEVEVTRVVTEEVVVEVPWETVELAKEVPVVVERIVKVEVLREVPVVEQVLTEVLIDTSLEEGEIFLLDGTPVLSPDLVKSVQVIEVLREVPVEVERIVEDERIVEAPVRVEVLPGADSAVPAPTAVPAQPVEAAIRVPTGGFPDTVVVSEIGDGSDDAPSFQAIRT